MKPLLLVFVFLTLAVVAQPTSARCAAARDAGATPSAAAGLSEALRFVSPKAKLTADDAAAGDSFGRSVSLSGDRALVGSFADDDAGSTSGSAYIFAGIGTVGAEDVAPSGVALSAPVPNPVAGRATLALTVDAPQHVRAVVVDALGRELAVAFEGVVTEAAEMDAFPAGIHVVRVAGASFALSRRLTVVR